jgi:hypothetical protein
VKYGRLIEGPSKPDGKIRNPENFTGGGGVEIFGKCNVLEDTGTSGQDEKHSLQRRRPVRRISIIAVFFILVKIVEDELPLFIGVVSL